MFLVCWAVCYGLYVLLQAALEDRAAHEGSLEAYLARVQTLEDWLTQARITNAGEPMITYDTAYLRGQIDDNQVRKEWVLLWIDSLKKENFGESPTRIIVGK